jgi:hypothetical protein
MGPMETQPKPVVVARNRWIVPKQRCIERITLGYAIRELCDTSQGRYWCVVAAFGLKRGRKTKPIAA